ncbi:MAG: hypothetical protein QNJ53_18495, partial [Pleurocapsa sp. MO_192.B19]|nr:hypothetical protein [Pleurocapsa sp. MO_192.B19]
KSPVTVIVRTLMEVVLAESQLDELFEKTAQTGYTKEILFSTLVKMMTQVVCSVRQSIGAVYKATADELGVSKSAVYGKLNRLEPNVSQALVRYSAREMTAMIEQVGGQLPALLPKYRVKILALQWSRSHRPSAVSAAQQRSWSFAGEIFSPT